MGETHSDLFDSGSDWAIRGCPGDEIAKAGACCFMKTPNCFPIAGLRGLACPKKGPNRPKWRGDNSPHGLPGVGMPERGYGDPIRGSGTWATPTIGALTRHSTSRYPPTLNPPVHPVGRRRQEPDPAIVGDEITKTGAYCFTKTPNCPLIAGLRGLACPKKGPNRPNWEGDHLPHGLLDVVTGNCGSGDPGRNAPDFSGPGDVWEENTLDIMGGTRYDNTL